MQRLDRGSLDQVELPAESLHAVQPLIVFALPKSDDFSGTGAIVTGAMTLPSEIVVVESKRYNARRGQRMRPSNVRAVLGCQSNLHLRCHGMSVHTSFGSGLHQVSALSSQYSWFCVENPET